MLLVGCALLAFSIGSLMIHYSRFTKITDVASGLNLYKDKVTGKTYVAKGYSGFLMEIKSEKN